MQNNVQEGDVSDQRIKFDHRGALGKGEEGNEKAVSS